MVHVLGEAALRNMYVLTDPLCRICFFGACVSLRRIASGEVKVKEIFGSLEWLMSLSEVFQPSDP